MLTGAVVVLCIACSGAPNQAASPSTAAVTTDTELSDTPETTGPGSGETGAPDSTDEIVDTSDSTDSVDSTAGSSAGAATTVATPATATGRATTTTVRAGGATTSTTPRATTTTVKPKPTTTVALPPTTPPPTPAPTPPPTPAPTSPPRTIGSCQQLSLDTVNGWRATLGRPALSSSSSLYNGACNWATHLAETDTHSHAPGVSGEVIALNSGNCTIALSMWMGSNSHYAVLTSTLVTTGGIACVKDSDGTFWAVGRVA